MQSPITTFITIYIVHAFDHAEKWSISGNRKILLWKSSSRKTNIVWNQIYCSWGKKLIFCVKWIICQQCIFLLVQEEIILTAKSRLFSHGAKGFHLPQVDLSVRDDMLNLWKKPKKKMLYDVSSEVQSPGIELPTFGIEKPMP